MWSVGQTDRKKVQEPHRVLKAAPFPDLTPSRVRCNWPDVGPQDQYLLMLAWDSNVDNHRLGGLGHNNTASKYRGLGLAGYPDSTPEHFPGSRGCCSGSGAQAHYGILLTSLLPPSAWSSLSFLCFSSFPRLSCISSPPRTAE